MMETGNKIEYLIFWPIGGPGDVYAPGLGDYGEVNICRGCLGALISWEYSEPMPELPGGYPAPFSEWPESDFDLLRVRVLIECGESFTVSGCGACGLQLGADVYPGHIWARRRRES